jgi:hypothetical protein
MKNGRRRNILKRLLDPLALCLSPQGARQLIRMKADPIAQARIDLLAKKCNQGQLTDQERQEYETYVHFGNIIAFLKAKARLQFKRQPAS